MAAGGWSRGGVVVARTSDAYRDTPRATELASSVNAIPAASRTAFELWDAAGLLLAVVLGLAGLSHPDWAPLFLKQDVRADSELLATLHTTRPHSVPICASPLTSSQHARVTLLRFELHETSACASVPGHLPEANQEAPFRPGGPWQVPSLGSSSADSEAEVVEAEAEGEAETAESASAEGEAPNWRREDPGISDETEGSSAGAVIMGTSPESAREVTRDTDMAVVV